MSYRKHHIKSKIQKNTPKRPFFTKLWFWIIFLLVALILTGAYFALFFPGIQINTISISGNSKIKTEELQNIISNSANTGLINVLSINISSKSMLLVNANKIRQETLNKFPNIENVTIKKEWPETLTIKVSERQPVGIFCNFGTECYLIDINGVIYEPANMQEGSFVITKNSADTSLYSGKKIFNENIINLIAKSEKNLREAFNINVKEALIIEPARLNITTAEGWQIYFNLTDDMDINSQITKLNLLLNEEFSMENRKNLRYIDLRMKDRAIICDNSDCAK